jgi:hypothetical protein
LLKDVYKNSFSVSTAADMGAEYWLDKKCCRLTRDGETLVVGERYNKLYKLVVRTIKPASPAEVYVASKAETLQVCHDRFGHQSKQYVEKYLKKNMALNTSSAVSSVKGGCRGSNFSVASVPELTTHNHQAN